MHEHHRLIIIGSGPAGMSAALFAARAQCKPLVISGTALGGQLLRTNAVRNWPGIPLIEGPTLMRDLQEHAITQGAHIISDTVAQVSLTQTEKIITLTSGKRLSCDALIIACGTAPRKLYCPGELLYWNTGVYTALPKNLALYAGKPVHIIGGGNSAIHFASQLLAHNALVTLMQAGPVLTATDPATQQVTSHQNTHVLYNQTVLSLSGIDTTLTTITAANSLEQTTHSYATTAVFLALGGAPNTELFREQLALSDSGHIVVEPGTTLTSLPGVFAAGDVADSRYRHAITSAGQGCMAALDAERYLNGKVVIRY